MKASVVITKSFKEGEDKFSKDWKSGDFTTFFEEEGEYLDRLCDVTESQGKDGEGYTVTYTVTVVK